MKKKKQVDNGAKLYTLTLTKDDISTINNVLNNQKDWHLKMADGKVDDACCAWIDSVKHRIKTSKKPV